MSWRDEWVILTSCVSERIVSGGEFAFVLLLRTMPIGIQIFLWIRICAAGTGTESQGFNGDTYADMVAYYLLPMVSRAFSSMLGPSSEIARKVRDGTFKKYLTQPIDMLDYLF